MKSVLISIRPEWVEKIVNGEKTIEVRKSAPKEVPFKAYIYATRPKKYYKCGAVSTSDELLWLTNGKVEMGDGFKFWADGDEYQCLNGRIIGEFICDRIDEFYCASVPYQKENNLGYGHFVDNGVYKVNGWHEGVVFERNDRHIDSMLKNNDLKEMCLSAQEIFDYIGIGKHLYGWHISDLKIYDKPKELSEFYTIPESGSDCCCGCVWHETPLYEMPCRTCTGERKYLYRPPQSWQYVEELGE
jgi:predicted transcriptional regulator